MFFFKVKSANESEIKMLKKVLKFEEFEKEFDFLYLFEINLVFSVHISLLVGTVN